MKKIIAFPLLPLLLVFAIPVIAQAGGPPIPQRPPEGGYVLDALDWLDVRQEAEITSIASGLDKEGLAEIFVVTLDDCGGDKVNYRKQVFNEWGMGHADKDGLLILVCWYGGEKSRRSVEQEFDGGLGNILSSSITDQTAKDYFVSEFNNGSPGKGLVARWIRITS